jgi:hypothetical protein
MVKSHLETIKNNQGTITVEYALTMVIAAMIMFGVQLLFIDMSEVVLDKFMFWVKQFP